VAAAERTLTQMRQAHRAAERARHTAEKERARHTAEKARDRTRRN
jgi:hypothetical protein